VSELGERFAVKMHKEVAARVQALRSMLRFVFRVFCREPSRWPELLAEGQPGSIVVGLATHILRAEVGASGDAVHDSADAVAQSRVDTTTEFRPATVKAKAKANKQLKESFYPAVGKAKKEGEPARQLKGKAKAQAKAQAGPKANCMVVCDTCGTECSESEGSAHGSDAWYCFECWEIYYYVLQQQQKQSWY